MMNTVSRILSPMVAVLFLGCFASCGDSGHSLGTSLGQGSGGMATPGTGGTSGGGGTASVGGRPGTGGQGGASAGGTTGTGGQSVVSTGGQGGVSTGGQGGVSTGGQGGVSTGGTSGTGGQGGASIPNDAGTSSEDAATTTCANRGEVCSSSRACCGPLVCMSFGGSSSTCYESMPPPRDTGATSDGARDMDTGCPVCPPMKCAYGSPVDSNGCTLCQCNPAPDGGIDSPLSCALPEGCPDAETASPCPSTPPTNGGTCTGQTVCSYEDCPGTGHIQASCRSRQWAVSAGPCETVYCEGVNTVIPCTLGQVCIVRAGGALLADCIDNPCAPGLVSADCSSVTQGCTPLFSTTNGLTYYCNTCPAGNCP